MKMRILAAIAASAGALALTACGEDESELEEAAEEVGEDVEDAAEDVEDEVE